MEFPVLFFNIFFPYPPTFREEGLKSGRGALPLKSTVMWKSFVEKWIIQSFCSCSGAISIIS